MISCSVYRSELVRHEACAEGLELFDRLLAQCGPKSRAKRRIYVREWTPLHTVWLYATHGQFAIWAEQRGIIPRSDLSGSDLSGSNLSGSNLSRSDLSGSDLSRSDLSRSDLSRSDLSGSNLSRSDLSRSNLSGSNLSRSDLSGSDLSGSNLSRSDLSGSDLSGSNLSRSNLSRAYRGTSTPIPGWRTLATGYLERES